MTLVIATKVKCRAFGITFKEEVKTFEYPLLEGTLFTMDKNGVKVNVTLVDDKKKV